MTQGSRPSGQRLSAAARDEALELRALVDQAWELRRTPYLRDAVEAIVEWHERRALRWLERRQEQRAELVRLMRETDPGRRDGGR